MLDEGNEREEINLDMAFAPRKQAEQVRRHDRTQTEQLRENSHERRKQAEREYRAKKVQSRTAHRSKTIRQQKQDIKPARKSRPHRKFLKLLFAEIFFILLAVALLLLVFRLLSGGGAAQTVKNLQRQISVLDYKNVEKPEWEEDFLTPNEYSRPGEELTEVNSIFVHYTANRNTSAAQNRSYFESLKDTGERSASAHFIIGYDGEIIQCVPFDEIAYAVKTRNYDSISIECCYKSSDGSFTKETYGSLIHLLAYLVKKYGLSTDDILRHYDCGGKKCPIYYVEHEDDWEQLKRDVEKLLK